MFFLLLFIHSGFFFFFFLSLNGLPQVTQYPHSKTFLESFILRYCFFFCYVVQVYIAVDGYDTGLLES